MSIPPRERSGVRRSADRLHGFRSNEADVLREVRAFVESLSSRP